MAVDFLALLRRDHDDLVRGLDELLEPGATLTEIRTILDGIRLGLTAHAEAEDIVLYRAIRRCGCVGDLGERIERARSGHLTEEKALGALVCAPPGCGAWRDRGQELLELVIDHADYEEHQVAPAIRRFAPDIYGALAGAFATERLRQLAMLAPSAPVFVDSVAHAS